MDFLDFLREHTKDLLIPSPLILDTPGLPQFLSFLFLILSLLFTIWLLDPLILQKSLLL